MEIDIKLQFYTSCANRAVLRSDARFSHAIVIHIIKKKKMPKTVHPAFGCRRNKIMNLISLSRVESRLDRIADIAGVVPFNLPFDVLDLLELVTQFDD